METIWSHFLAVDVSYYFSDPFINSGYLYSALSRKLFRGALSQATTKEKINVLRSLQKEDTLFGVASAA